MKEIDIKDCSLNFINEMHNNALLASGNEKHFNMMTIGWALEGVLWSKKVISVFVKPIRYTYEFMEDSEYFSINFFNHNYQKEISLLGTVSGRDYDKLELVGFHLMNLENGIGFREADKVIICKKIYDDNLIKEKIESDVINKYYKKEEPHKFYIGEIVKIIDNTIN